MSAIDPQLAERMDIERQAIEAGHGPLREEALGEHALSAETAVLTAMKGNLETRRRQILSM